MNKCELQHRSDPMRARKQEEGLRVCVGHHAQIKDALFVLPIMARELTKLHSPMPQGIGRASPSAESVIPYRDQVGDERFLIFNQLISWCANVAMDRNVNGPQNINPEETSSFLVNHLLWILNCDYTFDFATEILERRKRAFNLLYPSGRRKFVVLDPDGKPVRCGESIDGIPCVGRLFAVLRDIDSLLPSELTCDKCGFTLPARSWLTFARQLQRQTAILDN